MSLETNPSIRSEWKLRLEIFLSTCWRIYSSIDKYFFRRKTWGPTDSRIIKLAAKSVESYSRHRATMNVEPLTKALAAYWQARQATSSQHENFDASHHLVIRGFADRSSKKKLVSSIRKLAVERGLTFRLKRSVFRPDVAYRLEGSYGLFAGLQIELTTDQEDIFSIVEQALTISELCTGFTVEQYFVSYAEESPLTNFALRNLGEFNGLLESSADMELAKAISSRLIRSEERFLSHRSEIDVAKLFLIADLPLPNSLTSKGWIVVSVSKLDNDRVRNPPNNEMLRGLGSPTDRRSDSPAIHMHEPDVAPLTNVTVVAGDVLMEGGRLLALDEAANPAFSFVAGRYGVVVGTPANLAKAAVKVPLGNQLFIPKGILLSSRADANWFHWLIETLPKLFYLDTEVPSNVPIIISDRIPETGKEALRLLTNRPIIEISPAVATRVGRLFVSSPVLFHPDPPELHLNTVTNKVNVNGLKLLREKILGLAPRLGSKVPGSDLIYVERTSVSRSLLNSRHLVRALKKIGFSVLNPAEMSFMDQVVAFNAAKRIVLVGGASMANLIFCSEGAVAVTLISKYNKGYKMPEVLAGLAGARVLYFFGRPVGNICRYSLREKVHAHYSIGIRQLTRTLMKII